MKKGSLVFRTVLLVGIAAFTLTAQAQTVSPESVGLSSERLQRINEMVEENIDAGRISGAVTLVARHGKIAHLQAQGVMDIETGKPMETDTIFRLASMSKPVAALAIMMLLEEGKVALNDPVSTYLPGFEQQQVVVRTGEGNDDFYLIPAEREITIKDLLTHTSGLMSGPVGTRAGNAAFTARHQTGLAWVDDLGQTPLEFQPGTRWAYSAVAGFDVLSRIVEKVSGVSFEDFLQQRVFTPLKMDDIFFWPNDDQRQRLVGSYVLNEAGALTARPNPDSMSGEVFFSGAGGLMATAEAYAQFAMMLAQGGELNGVRLLGTRTTELMRSAFISDALPGRSPGEGYGLGVRVVTDPVKAGSLLSPGTYGWSGFYGTYVFMDPQEELVGVMLIQSPITPMRQRFDTAVMQAVID
ncbi:MAG: serine hydrolase domain-containing protein [Pseudomonadota bacterium]